MMKHNHLSVSPESELDSWKHVLSPVDILLTAYGHLHTISQVRSDQPSSAAKNWFWRIDRDHDEKLIGPNCPYVRHLRLLESFRGPYLRVSRFAGYPPEKAGDLHRRMVALMVAIKDAASRFSSAIKQDDSQDKLAQRRLREQLIVAIGPHTDVVHEIQIEFARHIQDVIDLLEITQDDFLRRVRSSPSAEAPISAAVESVSGKITSFTYPVVLDGITFLSPTQIRYGNVTATGQRTPAQFLRSVLEIRAGREGGVLASTVLRRAGSSAENINAPMRDANRLLDQVRYSSHLSRQRDTGRDQEVYVIVKDGIRSSSKGPKSAD